MRNWKLKDQWSVECRQNEISNVERERPFKDSDFIPNVVPLTLFSGSRFYYIY